jgi:lysophospholipase L1-like esterase
VSERTVLCFGDSNTYGYDAETGGRFARDVRWPGVLAAELGASWHVIEEGLGGRTTVYDDPLLPHANGLTYLVPCLHSHAPLDVVVLFLGVNDLKPRIAAQASDVARGVATLVQAVRDTGAADRIVVLGLPRLGRLDETDDQTEGVAAKAARLPALLRRTAEELDVEFVDLAGVTAFADVDGRHLDSAGHRAIGRAVAAALTQAE